MVRLLVISEVVSVLIELRNVSCRVVIMIGLILDIFSDGNMNCGRLGGIFLIVGMVSLIRIESVFNIVSVISDGGMILMKCGRI